MDGFPNVKITSFKLPADAPEGGIQVELGTVLTSPSPIGVQLGTIQLQIGYEGVNLGVVSAQGVNLRGGDNDILLKGRLVPQSDNASLATVSKLFSRYVAGEISQTSATGVSCAPDGVNPVTWLSEGFKTVQLNVALAAAEPLKIINTVSMGQIDLKFDNNNPYAPIATAPNVVANFQIPFGFSLNITEVTQNITLGLDDNGKSSDLEKFAVIQVPYTPAISDQKAGTLKFGMTNTPIAGISNANNIYDEYVYSLTASDNYTFGVAGNATTKVSTPIGPITLGGISFSVPTSLRGLQFLNGSATVINSLDVTGGTSDGMILGINVTMVNPSDVTITTGDVYFRMAASDVDLGLVTLKGLTLSRGSNTVAAIASFDPKSSDVGQNLLSSFVMGGNSDVQILGFENSTSIAPLSEALSAISITSTLPGLTTALIQGSALTVYQNTNSTGVVGVKVSIANPFSAGLSINKVVAAATYQGTPVGNIDQDISSNPFIIPGKSTAQSQDLSMTMNIEPAAIALLLRQLAVNSNMDTKTLDALLGLGGFHVAGQQDVAPEVSAFAGFNISDYTLQAMKALKVDLSLSSGLGIGQYTDTLAFSQNSVAVSTDNSVLDLIPIVGQKIVQQIVDGAVLAFDTIIVSSPTDSSFTVQMKGSITKSGPMDAAISFPTPLTVYWQGTALGTVSMPEIQAKAGVGASFDVTGAFTIANQDYMAQFSTYLINNENFKWEIVTKDVSVTALGFTFTGISMDKTVALTGCNGFKDAVTIQSFDLPSDDPNGGITLTAQTTIKNPSQVGFNLSGVTFETYFKDVDIGPLSSNGNAIFPPQGSSGMGMKGRMIYQNTPEGISAVTKVFENYLNNTNSVLTVKGVSGSGPNGQVGWLSTAFKSLTINNVVLPAPGSKPKLIPTVTMKQLTLDFTKDAWAPPSSSSNVEAQLKSPFGFPLHVTKLNMNVAATYQGGTVATLAIPDESASTSSTGVVTTQFSDVPFKVANKELFVGFVTLLTSQSSATFGLQGTTNAYTETAIGNLQLNGIGLDVQTSLAGFNNFGGKLNIDSLVVSGATKDYITVDLVVSFVNPSNITLVMGDANFDIIVKELNGFIGKTYMKDVIVPPGNKSYPCVLHMGEGSVNSKAISLALADYMTGANVPLTVAGSTSSTNIVPLQNGLSTVRLDTTMYGINANLIKQVAVSGTLLGLVFENKASAAITLQNPLGASFKITKVNAAVTFTPSSGGSPFKVGSINYDVSNPTTIPGHGSAQTDPWPVTLDKGSNPISHLLQMLGMLLDPNKYFYVEQNVTVVMGDGYAAEMYYYQDKVPFSISIDGLPPIGITASDLSKISIPSNISMSDPAQLMGFLSHILSGKPLASAAASSSIPASSVASSISSTTSATVTSEPSSSPASSPTTTSAETTTDAPKTTDTTHEVTNEATHSTTTTEAAQTTKTEAAHTTTESEKATTTEAPKETAKATEKGRTIGAYLSGALLAFGWWIFIDAVINSSKYDGTSPMGFEDWFSGLLTTFGMIVINLIDKNRLQGEAYSYSGTGLIWKARLFLFLGFALIAGGLAGSCCVLIVKYIVQMGSSQPYINYGISGVAQNALIMLSTVVLWVAQSTVEEYEYTLRI
ncbi:hypothetical protein G6F16_005541 [Rhizopus arrhizus]|nr:hypothetical protein G6F21_004003 [Rhizopus arrhizus]KAG0800170.1 hypothetical protein G6F22_002499 [Rhizopus arrhizus]KAG0814021.1 hypothetical protein G6F20_005105 [Rhizopus arrhizus]KAG0858840.1 hypothetical protein G6F17_002443 [Rhizopus arrhizus]KAG0871925.1 hypothetical protein G6F16_005541 [Rhizopus arrhizus]